MSKFKSGDIVVALMNGPNIKYRGLVATVKNVLADGTCNVEFENSNYGMAWFKPSELMFYEEHIDHAA